MSLNPEPHRKREGDQYRQLRNRERRNKNAWRYHQLIQKEKMGTISEMEKGELTAMRNMGARTR